MPSASNVTSLPCLAGCPALVVEAETAGAAMEGDGIPVVDMSSPCDHGACGL